MLEKILISLFMMFLCTTIHALFMMISNHVLEKRLVSFGHTSYTSHPLYKAVLIWQLIMWLFLAICIEAALWGFVYLFNPEITALPDARTAFYFSMVTYTSLGYGDIVLTGDWRILSAIEAANGLIIFGWTTALIFFFIQRIYKVGQHSGEN